MVGGEQPLGIRGPAGDFARNQLDLGESGFFEKQVIDPPIRKANRVRLDERVGVVPGDAGFLRMEPGKKVRESLLPDRKPA